MSNTAKRQEEERASSSAIETMEASNIIKKPKLEHQMISVGHASFTTDVRTKEEIKTVKKLKLEQKNVSASVFKTGVGTMEDDVLGTDSLERNTSKFGHHSATRTDLELSSKLGSDGSSTLGNSIADDNFQTTASQSIPSQDADEGQETANMIQPEDEYYLRYISLLLSGGTVLLCAIFENALLKKGETLDQFLKSLKLQKHDRNFNEEQKKILFPATGSASIEDFDITLLYQLINCHLRSHVDRNIMPSVTKIRDLRNKHAHTVETKMDTFTFNIEWSNLVITIQNGCTGISNEVKTKLTNLIDNINLINSQKRIETILKDLKILVKKEDFTERIQKKLDDIQTSQDKIVEAIGKFGECHTEWHTEWHAEWHNKFNQALSELKKVTANVKKKKKQEGKTTKLGQIEGIYFKQSSSGEFRQHSATAINPKQVSPSVSIGRNKITLRDKLRKFRILPSGSMRRQKELKENLIGFYRYHQSTMQTWLLEDIGVDLVDFYVKPPMTAIDLQRKVGNIKKSPVKFSKQLLYQDDQNAFKNIYVTADSGLGKTSFCKRICMAWCQAHAPLKSLANKFDPDEVLALKGFDFLFLIPLRDAHESQCDLDAIICAYLQSHLPRSPHLNILDTTFNESSCLILLDGLDEWSHSESCAMGHHAREIPHRKFRKNWTILTTTRPSKFDKIRLASHQIDRHIEINELDDVSSHQLVVNSVNLLNKTLSEDKPRKSVEDFYNTVSLIKFGEISKAPYIYLQYVCLWFEGYVFGCSKCEIYVNVIELTLSRGIERIKSRYLPPAQVDNEIHVPKCIMGTRHCKQLLPLLLNLSKLAFYALFDSENRQRLILNVSFAMHYLNNEEMDFCLMLGLLSQHNDYHRLSQKISNLSFLQNSVQEWFAALYMKSYNHIGDKVKKKVVQTCTSLPSILSMSNVFIFLSGFQPDVYSELSFLIMQRAYGDQNIHKYRRNILLRTDHLEYHRMLNFQTMQIECAKEMMANGHEFRNLPLEDILIDEKSKHETYTSILHKLVRGNQGNIKSLSIRECENTEEVTQILETLDLSYLHSLYKLELCAVARQPDLEQLLRQSISTLEHLYLHCIICKQGHYVCEMTVLSKVCEEIIFSMPLLKSLSLINLILTHDQMLNVTIFIISRVTMTQIHMVNITCSDHGKSCPCVSLHLSGHENLQLLVLVNVPLSQLEVNSQHLEECEIGSLPSSVITSCLTSLPAAYNLHRLYCTGISEIDMQNLITTLPALSQLEELYIKYTCLTDCSLDLGTGMTRLRHIELCDVSMTSSALRALSRTVITLLQSVTVRLLDCTVIPEVEYEAVKEEILKSGVINVTFDRQGKFFNEFSFRKDDS